MIRNTASRRRSCTNDMGWIWGSSYFQSPEEYQLGAPIDEVTNVYTVGATAFALFGGYERTMDKWELSERLFAVASKAVSDDRFSDNSPLSNLERNGKNKRDE